MLPELTKGALDKILSGVEVKEPIFQFLGHKSFVGSTGIERHRLLMSDGAKSCSFVMLAARLSELITNGILSQHSIVQIKHYAISVVKNGDIERHIMVILNVDILVPGHQVGKILGSVNLGNTGGEEALMQLFKRALHLHPNQ